MDGGGAGSASGSGASSAAGPSRVPPSLALERTTLSWVRTALASIVVCILALRLAAVRDSAPAEIFAVLATFASAGVGLWHRYRQAGRIARMAAGRRLDSAGSVGVVTAFCVVLAVVSLILVLV